MTDRGRSRLRLLAAALVCAVLAAACIDGDDEGVAATTTTVPPPRTLLRVGVEEWPDCLNPLACASPVLRDQVLHHVLPVLFELDPEGEHVPSPVLAEMPTVDTDGQSVTVTYRLDPEARWADGRPMTSTDIRATWLAWMSTPGVDAHGYDRIAAIDDSDPLVAVVELHTPYADWRDLFGGERGFVLQADSFGGDTDLTGEFADELPFSAGPYRLVSWGPDLAVLAADEDYWLERRRPEIDQVRLVRVDDALASDEVAGFDLVVPAAADGDRPEGFDRFSVPTTSVRGVFFDRRTLLLQPIEHRQAIRATIDRLDLIASVHGDDPPALVTCLGWLPQVGPWCDESDFPAEEPDVELARFGLFTLGWLAGPDGVLERDGQRFEIPLSYDPADPVGEELAGSVAEALAAIGISTVPTEVPTEQWRQRPEGVGATGIGVFTFDLGISPGVMDLYGCPPVAASENPLGWCDQRLNAFTSLLDTTVDQEQRLELAHQLGDLVAADVAWFPLHRTSAVGFVRSDVVTLPQPVPLTGALLGRLFDFERD